MSCMLKRVALIIIATLIVLLEPAALLYGAGLSGWAGSCFKAYAEVGSIADGEDIQYDKNGDVLKSLGFDTSKMPDTYDPDATTNPYGSNVSTLEEVKEMALIYSGDDAHTTTLYGNNKPLDGKYSTFTSNPIEKSLSFIGDHAFVSAVKCDITGDGRDSALAIVYTNYSFKTILEPDSDDRNIYLRIYDPKTGIASDEMQVARFSEDRIVFDYLIQSQMEITAGDYDKDSVDEIAVYAPSVTGSGRNKITIFDLTDGKECENPYSANSWRKAWNYMLPLSNEKIINNTIIADLNLVSNVYNNIDLTSGDADNDGISDLIISYGASDCDISTVGAADFGQKVKRSLPSRSVLLYGNDQGQMLKDSQEISYGGESLIRVSFAFGDIDADGNEDMFIAGQLQSEQSDNISRAIGRYVYDSDTKQMSLESLDNLHVVDGTWSDDGEDFYTSNGWDGHYYSLPAMKANLAIVSFMGDQSDTRIYLDSVLYSYDSGKYDIVDELEDTNTDDDGNPVGSQALADLKGHIGDAGEQSFYYEYGADSGNFSASFSDYGLINRVTASTGLLLNERVSKASVIRMNDENKKLIREDVKEKECLDTAWSRGAACLLVALDSDRDSMVAKYTGQHYIQYKDPEVLAVLASAPYFKDVAAYDNGEMLQWCNTAFGSSSGSSHGHTTTFSCNLGIFAGVQFGSKLKHIIVNVAGGYARSETWGYEDEFEYEISYDTAGGEDAVVMFSTPSENYVYTVEGQSADDDGNLTEYKDTMVIAKPHKPVTQVLTLDDYMEIQKLYNAKDITAYLEGKNKNNVLPDITKYLKSTPGDPASYPKNVNDLPDEAIKPPVVPIGADEDESEDGTNNKYFPKAGDDWCGISYGSGTETQSLSYSHSHSPEKKNHMDGGYGSLEIGVGTDEDFLIFSAAQVGLHYDFSVLGGSTFSDLTGIECSGTVANMPRSAKGYGYDFSWKLLKYYVKDGDSKFPVITYIVDDVSQPPELPDNVAQDFDNTTDSQIALTWTYSRENPQKFEIYRFEDFPQGGGDKLVGTVGGGDYRILKDEDGNTLKDKSGHVIRSYTFLDTDLTADTKYSYRMKVITQKLPGESIFSPVIEARTDVGTKPDLSLSADKLTIYPDTVSNVKVNLADPENYQKEISYQWQIYNEKKHKWEDFEGRDKQVLHFFKCEAKDAGRYRCRVNLIRKRESSPQYISTFTEECEVVYSKRDVEFSDITVFEGEGDSDVNTGVKVTVSNANQSSPAKPTQKVIFTIKGPNGTFQVGDMINEATGVASVESIEDLLGTNGQRMFVDGGYVITATYMGDNVFYASTDPEEYHYLRNIDECVFLSTKSEYSFGDDIMETTELLDYRRGLSGKVSRTDLTDKLSEIKFYAVGSDGKKTGEAVSECTLADTDGKVLVPLDKGLSKRAYVEAYMDGESEPVASNVIDTIKIDVEFSMDEKMTGTGSLLEFITYKDVELSNGVDPEKKNIVTDDGAKSLSDYMIFDYYEQNGEFMFDSDHEDDHKDEMVPASYYVTVKLRGTDEAPFYKADEAAAKYTVVGNYYLVTAEPKDKNTGSVQMVSPGSYRDFKKKGYSGGTTLTLKAVPNVGYEIKHWTIDECGTRQFTEKSGDKLTYTVKSQNTEGTGEITIKAVMGPKNNTLKYEAIGNGSVEITPEIDSGSTVLADTKVTVKATPEEGWRFEEWRWVNHGGNNIVSGGVTAEDGTNTKTFTMPDNSAEVYGVFKKDTINIFMGSGLEAAYLNDGSNPDYDKGIEVVTEKGRDVPRGATVTVRTMPGFVLAPGESWDVQITTPEGIQPAAIEEIMSQGRPAARFTLPEDVISCVVNTKTKRGQYTIEASSNEAEFTIYVDGSKMEGTTVDGIESGAQIDVTVKPERGKLVSSWIVNGDEIDSKEMTYSFNLIDNAIVSIATEADEEKTLTVSTEGGGKAQYVITDKGGDMHDGTFMGDTSKVSCYKGESVTISVAEDDPDHTLTAVLMDGLYQTLEDGNFTLTDIQSDAEIVCRFGSNTFYSAAFRKHIRDVDPVILDEDGAEVSEDDVLQIPKNADLEFSVVVPSGKWSYVSKDGEMLTPVSSESYDTIKTRIYYKIEKMTEHVTLDVSDHETVYIYDKDDLISYFNTLNAAQPEDEQPSGVLMNDIKMHGEGVYNTAGFRADFDGQGHAIFDMAVGSEDNRIHSFEGIFGNIAENGSVRNLILIGAEVYARVVDGGHSGMLTYTNNGTISNVNVLECEFNVAQISGDDTMQCAMLVYNNCGTIEYCKVDDSTLISDTLTVSAGSAGVVFNQKDNSTGNGVLRGNYFENFRVKGYDKEQADLALNDIVALEGEGHHHGVFSANIYKNTYDAVDSHGKNAYRLTDDPDDRESAEAEAAKPEFSKKIAYKLNEALAGRYWGASPDDVEGLAPMGAAEMNCVAPIQIIYDAPAKTVIKYTAPGAVDLPGEEIFGDDTPDAWELDGAAYGPGATVNIVEDKTFTGIVDFDEYAASLSEIMTTGEPINTRWYKDVNDAVKDAMAVTVPVTQILTVVGEGTVDTDVFDIATNMTVTIKDGAVLTIKKNTQINNSGTIMIEPGATVHKYGSLNNEGSVVIPEGSFFYNYGSAFNNNGLVNDKANIICKPHQFGEWTYYDEPDDEGRWMKTSTCTVCGEEVTDEVQPNPPAVKVDRIEVFREPGKITYEVGESFTDDELMVIAVLKDGTKTAITNYTLALAMGDEEQELKNGDVFEKDGEAEVRVRYGAFKCSFDIRIMHTADLLTITDADGNEITEKELEPGLELDLKASLKSRLPYKTSFMWESSDIAVAGLDTYELSKSNTVIARDPGDAVIKVTVVDENGAPIEAIEPKTVHISNVSHITDIKIVGGDISIDKDQELKMTLSVTPVNTTDKVEWTSSNEDVAAVDENGLVTGVGGGKAEITVTAPNGLSDSRKVYVYEKAKNLILDPTELDVRTDGFNIIAARVENPNANGKITWTIDDVETASFYVLNEKTGEMETAETVETSLSGDGSDTSDAYVIIAGLKAGTATVKASTELENGDVVEKECEVTVSDSDDYVVVTHNGASCSGLLMKLSMSGHYVRLGARSSEEDDTFTWAVIDDDEKSVLKVDSNGSVTFKRRGTAAVRVTSNKTGATDICMIKVYIDPTGVVLSKDELDLVKGDTYELTASFTPEEAEGKIIWDTSDDRVAKVSDEGVITAVGKGNALITAQPEAIDAKAAECKVTVSGEPAEIKLSKTELMVAKGKKGTLTAEVTPADAEGEVIWSSSDPSVATVSKTGVVKGLKVGTVTITARFSTSGSKPETCVVDVYDPKLTVTVSRKTYTYDGKKKIPKFTVKSGDTVLCSNITKSNSTVMLIFYRNGRKMPGIYKVTVVARDWHYGSGTAKYEIKVKPTKIKKLVKGRKSFTVKWKKIKKKYVTGYSVRFGMKKNMKGATYRLIKSWKLTSKVFKGLKGGKKYYVQIRTYYKKGGVIYYSKWSKKKAVKVKK